MQDKPSAEQLIAAVAEFLRGTVLPAATGRIAYDVRVAINALELSIREIGEAAGQEAAEHSRLRALVEADGPLAVLNRAFCAQLRSGALALDTPGVADHLWQTTLGKLAVDQPNYAAYRAEISAPPQQ